MVSWFIMWLLGLDRGVEKVEGEWIVVMEIFVLSELRRCFCWKMKEDLWAGQVMFCGRWFLKNQEGYVNAGF